MQFRLKLLLIKYDTGQYDTDEDSYTSHDRGFQKEGGLDLALQQRSPFCDEFHRVEFFYLWDHVQQDLENNCYSGEQKASVGISEQDTAQDCMDSRKIPYSHVAAIAT